MRWAQHSTAVEGSSKLVSHVIYVDYTIVIELETNKFQLNYIYVSSECSVVFCLMALRNYCGIVGLQITVIIIRVVVEAQPRFHWNWQLSKAVPFLSAINLLKALYDVSHQTTGKVPVSASVPLTPCQPIHSQIPDVNYFEVVSLYSILLSIIEGEIKNRWRDNECMQL